MRCETQGQEIERCAGLRSPGSRASVYAFQWKIYDEKDLQGDRCSVMATAPRKPPGTLLAHDSCSKLEDPLVLLTRCDCSLAMMRHDMALGLGTRARNSFLSKMLLLTPSQTVQAQALRRLAVYETLQIWGHKAWDLLYNDDQKWPSEQGRILLARLLGQANFPALTARQAAAVDKCNASLAHARDQAAALPRSEINRTNTWNSDARESIGLLRRGLKKNGKICRSIRFQKVLHTSLKRR